MGRQSLYPEEFRKDAVALYRAADGKRTYAAVAADVGVSGETLRTWVRKDTARNARSQDRSTGVDGTEADELARQRAENRGCAVRRRNGSSNARSCAGQPRISQRR
ncbi:transposase [Rhodococcus jostii]|uniref:transposase n=1 Tax=Rhodococcus jostii TaxID=132919 RepID=UPI003632C7E4